MKSMDTMSNWKLDRHSIGGSLEINLSLVSADSLGSQKVRKSPRSCDLFCLALRWETKLCLVWFDRIPNRLEFPGTQEEKESSEKW